MAAMLISAQAVDYDGAVLSGAKLNVYDAGTTTPRAIYASKELASGASSANPAVATATGGIAVWVDDSAGDIKVTLTNSAGTTTYYSQDNIDPTNGNLLVFPLGGQDQTLATTDSVAFAGVTLSGDLDMQGNRIVLDADNDSYIEVNSDDSVSIFIGGTEVIKLDASASDAFTLDGVSFSPTGAAVGQALGYPNSTTIVEPYTPAGAGDVLAAVNETISGYWNFTAIQFTERSAEPTTAGVGSVAYSDGTDSTNGFGTDAGFQVFDGTQWAPLTHAVPIESYGPGAGRGTAALDQVAFAAAATAGAMVSLKPDRTYYMTTGLTPADGFGIEFGPGSKIVAVTQASGSGSAGFKNYSGLSANRNAIAGTMFMLTNAGAEHTFVNPLFEGDNSNQPILRPIYARGNTLEIIGRMTVRNMNAAAGALCLNEMLGGFVESLDVRGNADMVDSAYSDLTNYSPAGLLFDDDGTYRSSGMDFGSVVVMDLNRDSAGGDPRESDGVTLGGTNKAVRAGARDGHSFSYVYADNVGEAIDCFQSNNVFDTVVARNVLGFGVKFIHGAQNNIVQALDIDGFYYSGVVFSGSSAATAHCSGNKVLGGRIAGADAASNTDACPVWITDNNAGTASVPKSNLVRGVDFVGNASSDYVIRSNLDATTAGAISAGEETRIENCRNLGSASATAYALDAESTISIDAASEFGDVSKRASATERGQVELATNAEVATGTDTARAVTPAGAAAHFAPLSSPTFTNGYGATHATSNVVAAVRRSQPYSGDTDSDQVIALVSYQYENSAEATVAKFQEYYRAQGRTAGSESARKMYRVFSGAAFRDHNINYDGFDAGSGAVYKVAGTQVVGARVIDADLADTAALTAQTLTDNSGGTAADTIAAIGATYSQSEVANAVASLADEINKLRADNVAQKAALDAALTLIRSHGLGAIS
jgi:uncharacterized small protein (DUF1192 family)